MEHKASKAFTMGIEGRTVTGIFAVHGNVDDGDGWSTRDRSHPGLFGDFKVNGRDRVVFLWQHNSYDPPIAKIDQIFEVSAADLPPAVKAYAPDSTGGVAVKRTYLETPRASEVLAGLVNDALKEMSYSYEPLKPWTIEEQENGLPIRDLFRADLYDISDVNWGMNPATSADGTKDRPIGAHGDAVKAAVADYIARIQELAERRAKEGRVFSAANYAALKALADDLDVSVVSLRELLATSEPKQQPDIRQLWLETQRTLATLNGVRL